VIRVENLKCGYSDHPVLKGISFGIESGEFVGILGPNGSGKTTLLLALSGVTPIQAGSVEITGQPIERLKPKERARRMAVIAQDGDARFPFSCEEVVRMGRFPHQKRWRMDSAQDSAVVGRVLRITDTQDLSDRLITAISGGERQRVFMARALAQETPILLLDEATSAMDIHRKLQIFTVLRDLNHKDGLTVMAVLHDVNLAALFCRRIIFFKEGKIVADGSTDEVLTPEILEDVYRTRVLVQEIGDTGKRQVVFLPA
jgi:iron complex transport system ATP-binding protein